VALFRLDLRHTSVLFLDYVSEGGGLTPETRNLACLGGYQDPQRQFVPIHALGHLDTLGLLLPETLLKDKEGGREPGKAMRSVTPYRDMEGVWGAVHERGVSARPD
jgi:hypothetical protein